MSEPADNVVSNLPFAGRRSRPEEAPDAAAQLAAIARERDALQQQLRVRERELEAALAREETERRARFEVESRAAEDRRAAQTEIAALRRRLEAAEQRATQLEAALAGGSDEVVAALAVAVGTLREDVDRLARDREEDRARLERLQQPMRPVAADPAAVEGLRTAVDALRGAPGAPEPIDLAGDLAAAAERLRAAVPFGAFAQEPTAPGAEAPRQSSWVVEAAPAGRAVAPAVSAEPEPDPVPLPARRPAAGRLPAPWLGVALQRLAVHDPAAAARLLVDLLPVQGLRAQRAVTYALHVQWAAPVTVAVEPGSVRVTDGADARLAVAGPVTALAPLVAGGAGRQLPAATVKGRKRALRRLLRDLRGPVGLVELVEAGATPDPGVLLAALGHAVAPEWLGDRHLCVAFELDRTLRVETTATRRLRVAEGDGGEPDATIRVAPEGLVPLLAGVGEAPPVRGSVAAATALLDLLDRAQG